MDQQQQGGRGGGGGGGHGRGDDYGRRGGRGGDCEHGGGRGGDYGRDRGGARGGGNNFQGQNQYDRGNGGDNRRNGGANLYGRGSSDYCCDGSDYRRDSYNYSGGGGNYHCSGGRGGSLGREIEHRETEPQRDRLFFIGNQQIGLAFHPLDGILQAVPHVIALFLVPTHFTTHIALLFIEGIWTANIHDCIHGKLWPVMGAGYHTIHHTTYRHNYGHYTIWMDWMFGTLCDPVSDVAKKAK